MNLPKDSSKLRALHDISAIASDIRRGHEPTIAWSDVINRPWSLEELQAFARHLAPLNRSCVATPADIRLCVDHFSKDTQ